MKTPALITRCCFVSFTANVNVTSSWEKTDILLCGFLLPRQVFRDVMCSDAGQDFNINIPLHQINSHCFSIIRHFKSLHLNSYTVLIPRLLEMSNWSWKCVFSTVCFTGCLFSCQWENFTLIQFHIQLVYSLLVRNRVFLLQSLLTVFWLFSSCQPVT